MMMRRLLATVVLIAMTAAGCRETGDVQVTSIKFTGATAVQADELKGILATQESGFLPWSRKRFFDRPEFDRDVKRIEAFYADRGYPRAKVVGVDVALNDAKDKVAITVEINEGEPTIVEKVIFDGFDGVPADHLERLQARLPIAAGKPRDQRLILASHDMAVAELRDHGFPYGNVRMVERPGSTDTRVAADRCRRHGPASRVRCHHHRRGRIGRRRRHSPRARVSARAISISSAASPRRSGASTASSCFSSSNVVPRLPEDRSPQVPVVVTVAEGKHRRLQLAAGYGSEEKARGRINWRHVNFGGGARTGEVEAKASSLEQGLRGSFTEPFLFQRGLSLRLSGSTWWADEPVYEYRSSGGTHRR